MVEVQRHIRIRVVYNDSNQCFDQALRVPVGSRLIEALEVSQLFERFPDLDLTRLAVGIFGQQVNLDQKLNDGDRIEVLRPLQQSPTAARRARAEYQ